MLAPLANLTKGATLRAFPIAPAHGDWHIKRTRRLRFGMAAAKGGRHARRAHVALVSPGPSPSVGRVWPERFEWRCRACCPPGTAVVGHEQLELVDAANGKVPRQLLSAFGPPARTTPRRAPGAPTAAFTRFDGTDRRHW